MKKNLLPDFMVEKMRVLGQKPIGKPVVVSVGEIKPSDINWIKGLERLVREANPGMDFDGTTTLTKVEYGNIVDEAIAKIMKKKKDILFYGPIDVKEAQTVIVTAYKNLF